MGYFIFRFLILIVIIVVVFFATSAGRRANMGDNSGNSKKRSTKAPFTKKDSSDDVVDVPILEVSDVDEEK